jgi:site-specific recombinase XerD
MRSTFKLLFYINRGKIKSDGTTAVMCRISIDGKTSVLSTGIFCRPDNWNAKKSIIKTERDNNFLTDFRKRIEQTYEHKLKQQKVVSSELLKNTIIGINSIPTRLLEAGRAELERLRIRSIEKQSNAHFRLSKNSQLNLQAFILSQEMDDIALSNITPEFAESFKIYLKSIQERRSGYINNCLTWLNRLLYIAVDEDVLRCNPLEDVKYEKREPLKHRHLCRDDLKRIMETPMIEPRLELVRRAFIFSSLTGLAYADMFRLYPRHISKTTDGRMFVRKEREKTDIEAFIPLHPIAVQILSLYNTEDESKPVFPLPSRSAVWWGVNQFGVSMRLNDGFSYHQSRHSFGTLALSSGLSIESVAKMMGHSSISTTQRYAKITEQKISSEMDRLMVRRKLRGSLRAVNNNLI